jgi:wyosine [tRNA(Phe)-imidazoG37] synthetase (radical SAM superfamily)
MPLHRGIVYGPVRSRRLGRSLGINLTPANIKLCSFNCTYCQYGWTQAPRRPELTELERWPAPAAVARAVGQALAVLASRGEKVDRLTLAGHGEPTLHPKFADVVRALLALRDKEAPGVPIAILSNASTLARAGMADTLRLVDERYMKLDAGDAAMLRSVNGAVVPFEQLVASLEALPEITLQAMFVRDRTGRVDNTSEMAVIRWVTALQRIKPRDVHIYTLDRAPAWPYLQPVPAARLQEIAQRVRQTGLRCKVFGIEKVDVPASA